MSQFDLDDFEIIDEEGNVTEIDFKLEKPVKQNGEPLDQRMRIINEIYDTEETYVQGLKLCIKYFYEPLNENNNIIAKDKLDTIFLHFPDVQSMNSSFFQQLKSQKENGKLYDSIGSIFVEFSHFFKIYKLIVGNSEAVLAVLKDVCSSPYVSRYLEQQRLMINAKTQLDLRSYLITPVQRLPRYNLLLTELLKNTPKEHPDYENIVKALAFLKECTQFANDSVRERERRDKLITISKTCEGTSAELIVKPGRSYVKSGQIMEIGKKINKPRYLYLFNDMLMYGNGDERKLSVMGMYNIESIMLKDVKDSPNSLHCFRILNLSNSEVDLTFQCVDEESKKSWVDGITNAAKDERNRLLTLRNEINTSSTTVWIPDEEANECMRCGAQFTLFFRKHHCRNCGYVICADCRTKCKVPKLGRIDYVCLKCFDELSTEGRRRNSLSASQPAPQVLNNPPSPLLQETKPLGVSKNSDISPQPQLSPQMKSPRSPGELPLAKTIQNPPLNPNPNRPSHQKTDSCQVQFNLQQKSSSDLTPQQLSQIQQQANQSTPPELPLPRSSSKTKPLPQEPQDSTNIISPQKNDQQETKIEPTPLSNDQDQSSSKRPQPSLPPRQQSNSNVRGKPAPPPRGSTTNTLNSSVETKPNPPTRSSTKPLSTSTVINSSSIPPSEDQQTEVSSFKGRIAMFQQQSTQPDKPALPIRRKVNPPQ